MRTALGKHLLPVLVLSVLGGRIGLAGEAPSDANSLTFEMSTEELAWNRSVDADADKWRPEYAAVVPMNESRCYMFRLVTGRVENRDNYLGFVMDRSISDEQKEFTRVFFPRTGTPIVASHVWIDADEALGRPRQVRLYAMSLDDAKKMAQAYWDYADVRYRSLVQQTKESIQRDCDLIQKGKKRLAELEDILKKAPVEFEELKKTVMYHDANQALEVVPDLDKAIHACMIEIAGIRTKLEYIESMRHKVPPPGWGAPSDLLNTIVVQETINLKGAEARLKTATNLRTQAQRYVDLIETLHKAPAEMDKVRESLRFRESGIQGYERQLAEMIPPAIPGGKVFIHKVRLGQGQ